MSFTARAGSEALWMLAAILAFWSFGFAVVSAGDLWWHLATGQVIFDSRSIPLVDSWSFTRSGAPWLQHEWLSDLLFHLWRAAFGTASLVYWKWGAIVGALLFAFSTGRRLSGEPASAFVASLFAATMAAPFLDLRPQLWTLLGYSFLLWRVLRDEIEMPLWLPVVFLVWVNLHGGFLLGLLALALASLFSPARRNCFRVVLLCAVTCLINPGGLEAFRYPLVYAMHRDSPYRSMISEWLPPFAPGGIRAPLLPLGIGLFVAASVYLLWRRERRDRVVGALLALGWFTLAMALTSRRFVPLFAISLASVAAIALSRPISLLTARVPALLPPALAAALGLVLIWPFPKGPSTFTYLTAADEMPVEVANFIQVNGLRGRVFSYYTWGGYLHFRTGGAMKTFIDSRANTVFDDDTLLRYRRFQGFEPGWREVLAESDADFILWPRDSRGKPLADLVRGGSWRPLYDDAVSVLLVRADRAPDRPMLPTPPSGEKYLAAGVKLLEAGRFDRAAEEMTEAVALSPFSPFACRRLADVYRSMGEPGRADERSRSCDRAFPVSLGTRP